MKLTVVGCGDAFGAGGRLQTCFHVTTSRGPFLIDCGATALIGFQRQGLVPDDVGMILISHLHGDHFSGLVWWLLHAQHISKRTAPLLIAGPPGIEARLLQVSELLFPESTRQKRRFELTFLDLAAGQRSAVGQLHVTAFEVCHPSGAPSLALRIEADGRVIGFSGDTEWVEPLVECARDSELFITECYAYERASRYHMNWRTLEANLDRLTAKRVLVTHMNPEMLANIARIRREGVTFAEDGLVLEV